MLSLLFKFRKSSISLEEMVLKIQEGDESLHNQLLDQYKPFIKKVVSSVCKRYIDEVDDEFSIGLIAFNEAIEKYSEDKGASLLSFAQLLIKRRVIDYIRKEFRHRMISIDAEDEDENTTGYVEASASIDVYTKSLEIEQRQEEIIHFQEVLNEFGLSFKEIVEHSPKHQDARENMIQIARQLVMDNDLRQKLFTKKRLPIKELTNQVDVSKKTLERNRKYIISMAIIISGDYVFLQDYLKGVLQS